MKRQRPTSKQEPRASIEDIGVLRMLIGCLLLPFTLWLRVAKSIYTWCVRIGFKNPLDFRSPPLWFMQFLAAPFAFINPPVVLGGHNIDSLTEGAMSSVEFNGSTGRKMSSASQNTIDSDTTTPPLSAIDGTETTALISNGGQSSSRAPGAEPVLLVGNQNLYGLDHIPLLVEIQKRGGKFPRGLYDPWLTYVPFWHQVAGSLGGVKGTLRHCEELMTAGQWQLLYPGGTREACKRSSTERYQLMWDDKLGFVRAAIKHGAAIVPFASVGVEDSLHVFGSIDVSWLRLLSECKDPWEFSLPLVVPCNTMQRQYFAFGKPIPTDVYAEDWENEENCNELFQNVRAQVQDMIYKLQEVQSKDPNRHMPMRLVRRCLSAVGLLRSYDDVILESQALWCQ